MLSCMILASRAHLFFPPNSPLVLVRVQQREGLALPLSPCQVHPGRTHGSKRSAGFNMHGVHDAHGIHTCAWGVMGIGMSSTYRGVLAPVPDIVIGWRAFNCQGHDLLAS